MMNNMPPVVKQLLIINIIVFVAAQIPQMSDRLYDLFPLYYFENPNFKIWQPITSMFMHGDILHIVFNMFGLVVFGSMLERFWGSSRFVIFYFICGLGAVLIDMLLNYYNFHNALDILVENGFSKTEILQTIGQHKIDTSWLEMLSQSQIKSFSSSLGASGAIFGLFAAFAFMFPEVELYLMFIPIPIKAKYLVPAMIALELYSAITGISPFGSNIDHVAHLGGALFGVIMMLFWRDKKFQHNRWN